MACLALSPVGRESILLKSMDWYTRILPVARTLAQSQGYEGARWPKMVDFEGKPCPSAVAPGLIWQQPHPIALAELCYKAEPTREMLERFRDIVYESAAFMVSFAHWDETKQAYDLGPPLIPAQECHPLAGSKNPPYELEYWKYGLEIAVRWAERLGDTPDPKWAEVEGAMAKPPQAEGVYLAHELCPDTFTAKNHDHPSMLGALGILPGTMIDRGVMLNTAAEGQGSVEVGLRLGMGLPDVRHDGGPARRTGSGSRFSADGCSQEHLPDERAQLPAPRAVRVPAGERRSTDGCGLDGGGLGRRTADYESRIPAGRRLEREMGRTEALAVGRRTDPSVTAAWLGEGYSFEQMAGGGQHGEGERMALGTKSI
ncbi:hypothetical protein LJK88_15080 [Paenibacillus sp. P26]|nr:hypothetical protein LJK88_15080 [Paenibacillus sp. P26]